MSDVTRFNILPMKTNIRKIRPYLTTEEIRALALSLASTGGFDIFNGSLFIFQDVDSPWRYVGPIEDAAETWDLMVENRSLSLTRPGY